jgi:hypothetical protein
VPVSASGLAFGDLYRREGLVKLDQLFLTELARADAALHERLRSARSEPSALTVRQESDLLLALAPHVDRFIGWLFGIENELKALSGRHFELAPLFSVKRLFVQRKAMHKYKGDAAQALDGAALAGKLESVMGEPLTELAFARHVTHWQQNEAENAGPLELALQYAAWAASTAEGRKKHLAGVLFKAPHKLDPARLVPVKTDESRGYPEYRFDADRLRHR